VKRFNGAP
jgi:hypothetical protein